MLWQLSQINVLSIRPSNWHLINIYIAEVPWLVFILCVFSFNWHEAELGWQSLAWGCGGIGQTRLKIMQMGQECSVLPFKSWQPGGPVLVLWGLQNMCTRNCWGRDAVCDGQTWVHCSLVCINNRQAKMPKQSPWLYERKIEEDASLLWGLHVKQCLFNSGENSGNSWCCSVKF